MKRQILFYGKYNKFTVCVSFAELFQRGLKVIVIVGSFLIFIIPYTGNTY